MLVWFGLLVLCAQWALRSALVHSSNRAAVHLLQRVGLGATIDLANRVGLDSMPAVPSFARA